MDRALRDRAYRERKKARDETPAAGLSRDETCDEIDRADRRAARLGDETRDETPAADLARALLMAAQGNADPAADLAPIRALLDQGCDLEADVVPVVARMLPELPRPLELAPKIARGLTGKLVRFVPLRAR